MFKEILEKYKNNIFPGCHSIDYEIYLGEGRLLEYDIDGVPGNFVVSLCDLLFNSPFIDVLTWKNNNGDWKRNYFDGDWDQGAYGSDYHKINLALLHTDEQRIKYLEDNVLLS